MGANHLPNDDVRGILTELISLDRGERESCAAAISRLQNEADKIELRRFLLEHELHAARLTPLVAGEDRAPLDAQEQAKHPSNGGKRWRVALAGLLGDKMILETLKRDEDSLRYAYLDALSHTLPPEIRPIIEENLRDELRHAAWIEERLLSRARSA